MKRLSYVFTMVMMSIVFWTLATSANGLTSEGSEIDKNQIIDTTNKIVSFIDNDHRAAFETVNNNEIAMQSITSKEEWQRQIDAANKIIEEAESLGLEENDDIIIRAKELLDEANDAIEAMKDTENANDEDVIEIKYIEDGVTSSITDYIITDDNDTAIDDEITKENSYTDEDLYCLANLIYYEARGCSDRHQQLVAQVCVNRSKDSRFPDTIKECIEQPGQYAAWYTTANPPLEQRFIDNARAALEGKVDCPSNVIFQAEFKQGTGVFEISEVDTGYWSSTTYFCYG